jgi:hypothetical protein
MTEGYVMKLVAQWAWIVVLGTALALSWWSLDALARHYGMPALLAGMVSTTFDGAAMVAAELAMRLARAAESTAMVKLLMLSAVGTSVWLNYEHGALLNYPTPVRVLFAAPPCSADRCSNCTYTRPTEPDCANSAGSPHHCRRSACQSGCCTRAERFG